MKRSTDATPRKAMNTAAPLAVKKPRVAENLGWLDRILRFIVGTAFISVSATYLFLSSGTPVWLSESELMSWPYYLMLIAIYPLFTAILGKDPIYHLLGVRTCRDNGKNPCGTFPYEMDAAIGHKPIPDSDIEHSLSASHHETKPRSHSPSPHPSRR